MYIHVVFDAHAYPDGNNKLVVNWTVPTQCKGGQFEISYSLILRKACPEEQFASNTTQRLRTTYTIIEISVLEAFSTYAITISTIEYRGSAVTISGSTLSSGTYILLI